MSVLFVKHRSTGTSPAVAGVALAAVFLAAATGVVAAQQPRAQQPSAQQPSPSRSSAQPPAAQQPANADDAAVGEGLAVVAAIEQTVVAAIARSAPSVVAIARVPRSVDAGGGASALTFNLPGLDRSLVDPTSPDYVPAEYASGVILSEDGMILTCYHVLDDPQANDYYVWWQGQARQADVQRGSAVVQAGDPWTDLAVLKIDARGLPAMTMGDATQLRRGSFVITLGNPYATARDGRASAGWGIVSNLQRTAVPVQERGSDGTPTLPQRDVLHQFGTLIQTDARLNHGSSGGALVNLRGEMIGLTTSLAAVAGYESAAGYAIPIDSSTLQTIAQLRAGRQPAFGFLGVEPADTPDRRGARVSQVVPGMPAADAGLQAGDLILAVDGQPIEGAVGLFREMSRRRAEVQVRLTIARSGAIDPEMTRQVDVRLGKKQLPASRPAYSIHAEPIWRGMQVDFSTALPASRLMATPETRRTAVAITRVDPDTPAWRAGLRAGQFVDGVAAVKIDRPQQFYEAVQGVDGPVTIDVVGPLGRSEPVVVRP